MDEFEQKSREVARMILERHGWKRPMTAEVKEMRDITDEPLTECKRYLLEEWQDMRVPLLEKENARLRELVREMYAAIDVADYVHDFDDQMHLMFVDDMRELGIEVNA